MTPIRWSPQAIRDVEAIRDYIAQDSRRYAQLTVDRIITSVERLRAFPQVRSGGARACGSRNPGSHRGAISRRLPVSVWCRRHRHGVSGVEALPEHRVGGGRTKNWSGRSPRRRPWAFAAQFSVMPTFQGRCPQRARGGWVLPFLVVPLSGPIDQDGGNSK